jgi:hypothetical protein
MTYQVADTPTVTVDHIALAELVNRCGQSDSRVVLVGFGEYSKHLVNLLPQHILAIYDPRPIYSGISFRNVPVLQLGDYVGCNLVVGCEYDLLYDYFRQVSTMYPNIEIFRPSRLHYKNTGEVKVFEQEAIYREIFSRSHEAPVSMMDVEKVKFLMEIMRYSLRFPGNLIEMGSWQGGSTWFLAQILQALNESRKLYALDLFEQHAIDLTATVCIDEVRRKLAFYPNAICLEGLIDDDKILGQIEDAPICFAHVDLGCIDKSMKFLWDRMPTGAPILLDNYGHAATTWEFDAFFDGVGARIIRFPWSEQGLVIR